MLGRHPVVVEAVSEPPIEYTSLIRLASKPREKPSRLRWLLRPRWALVLTLLGLSAVAVSIYLGGDRWWIPTVLMFGPKWVYALPLPVLFVWMSLARTRWWDWGLLAAAVAIVLFPLMNLCVPWRTLLQEQRWRGEAGRDDAQYGPETAASRTSGSDYRRRQTRHRLPPGGGRGDAAASSRPTGTSCERGGLVVGSPWELTTSRRQKRQHPPSRWPRPICLVVEVAWPERPFKFATVHLQSPRYGLAEIVDAETLIRLDRRETLEEQMNHRRAESLQIRQVLQAVTGRS